MTRRQRRSVITLLGLLLLGPGAPRWGRTTPASVDVPEPLRPWVSWVLQGHEAQRCPFLHGRGERRCAWPARLELDLAASGGSFVQDWELQQAGAALLPGGGVHWPTEVRVDGRPAAVVARDDRPVVWLAAGRYRISGRLRWRRLPESLALPPETGLLALRIEGRTVDFPERVADGTLWVQRRANAAAAEDQLELTVTRRVVDELPLELETHLELRVAGKSRELLLGPVLPTGFVPLALESGLPARVEGEGRLRLQLRPGAFELTLRARQSVAGARLVAPRAAAPWVEEEIWAFDARPELRVVAVEEAPAVDPGQTRLPAAWKHLPAYRLVPGAALVLNERRRGDSAPGPDELTLRRRWWLDFDGRGFTVADELGGVVRRSQRLEMGAETELGHVAVGGEDRLVTRRRRGARAAVEVPRGSITLAAESRCARGGRDTPALGWAHDFRSVSGELHLPPGWSLLHVGGVDDAWETWVAGWGLDDVFLLLVLLLATAKLFGARIATLAAVTLVATLTEPDAPRWSWAFVLAVAGLARVWPSGGRGEGLLELGRVAALVILALFAVDFGAPHLRQGMFPVLDPAAWAKGTPSAAHGLNGLLTHSGSAPSETPAEAGGGDETISGKLSRRAQSLSSYGEQGLVASSDANKTDQQRLLPTNDPNAMVQTGPGLQRWEGRVVSLRWSGPVRAGETLSLWLLPPWLNRLLAGLRVLLLAALIWSVGVGPLRAARRRGGGGGAGGSVATAAVGLLLAALTAGLAHADGSAQAAPDDEPRLHRELRRRLLTPPPCFPNCATIGGLALEANDDRLALRLEIAVAAATAVPLPGHLDHWRPQRVLVDGQPATELSRDGGTLWLGLRPGAHLVQLEGPLPRTNSLQLPLPLKPRQVETRLIGWQLDGVHDDGAIEDQLQLTRQAPAAASADPGSAGQPQHLPPFVRVERTLRFGLAWEVETRVVRMTPPGAAIVLSVPLLGGESVTSAGVHVRDGRVLVSIEATQGEATWRSALPARAEVALAAPRGVPWVERWTLEASPIWHVETRGVPPLHQTDASTALRQWAPLPGETLTLVVERPPGVAGQVLTVDHVTRKVVLGERRTETVLSFAARTSRGAEHALTLPSGAELEQVTRDGRAQPLRQEGRRVLLALQPGTQQLELRWGEPASAATLLRLPSVHLGAPAVNVTTEVSVPGRRWVLWVGGAVVGPVVLFWSQLGFFLIVALALSRLPWSPLSTRQWLLLGVGLTQLGVLGAATIAGWLLFLSWRGQRDRVGPRWLHNASQLLIASSSLLVLGLLLVFVHAGLLGAPDMQIRGNGSWGETLRWLDDRISGELGRPWLISVPLWIYRLAMLAWALWLATAVLGWLGWGWRAFTRGGIWQRKPLMLPPP